MIARVRIPFGFGEDVKKSSQNPKFEAICQVRCWRRQASRCCEFPSSGRAIWGFCLSDLVGEETGLWVYINMYIFNTLSFLKFTII